MLPTECLARAAATHGKETGPFAIESSKAQIERPRRKSRCQGSRDQMDGPLRSTSISGFAASLPRRFAFARPALVGSCRRQV